jgi:hypothetical protein
MPDDLNVLGSGTTGENNVDIYRSIVVTQSGDTLGTFDYDDINLEPNVPFEIHFWVIGGPGVLKVTVVHDKCGRPNECGPDYPNCPSAERKFDGSCKVLARVSGLPGGKGYQISLSYKSDGGGISTCRWLDLSDHSDTFGNNLNIQVELMED